MYTGGERETIEKQILEKEETEQGKEKSWRGSDQ